jgi:hypothetical protein
LSIPPSSRPSAASVIAFFAIVNFVLAALSSLLILVLVFDLWYEGFFSVGGLKGPGYGLAAFAAPGVLGVVGQVVYMAAGLGLV